MNRTFLLASVALALVTGFVVCHSKQAEASTHQDIATKVTSEVEREGSSGGNRQRRGGERRNVEGLNNLNISLNDVSTEDLPSRHGRGRDDAPGDDHGGRRKGRLMEGVSGFDVSYNDINVEDLPSRRGRGRDDAPGDDHGGRRK